IASSKHPNSSKIFIASCSLAFWLKVSILMAPLREMFGKSIIAKGAFKVDFGLTIKIPNKGAKENSHKRRWESSLGWNLEQSFGESEFGESLERRDSGDCVHGLGEREF
ncbi:hypothetical protein, partial [Campylobacter hyointestinalis]|uniref:hypothetical protein n=1 Tax=Campylobacter hyointestinalis TaxID=198 RepID=UPI0015EFBF89